MRSLLHPPELTPVAAGAAMAFVVFAVFAWTQSASVIDPDPDAGSPWPWRLWQLVGVIIAIAGVGMLSRCAGRVPRTRELMLGLFALAIFVNAYTPGFGDYYGRVWLTVPPVHSSRVPPNSLALRLVCRLRRRALIAAMGLVVLVNRATSSTSEHSVVWTNEPTDA